MKTIKETCYKGCNIRIGNEKRDLINKMIKVLIEHGFQEISLPIINYREYFKGKVGIENTSMMFSVKDNSDRDLVLAPEYTAIMMELAKTTFKYEKNVKLFYIQECFRGEKPQKGRYRQFTQLGVEILNPSEKYFDIQGYINLCIKLLNVDGFMDFRDFVVNREVTRGLDYYKEGKGFEIKNNEGLQLCGGGEYSGGIGFALGADRLI